MPAERGSGGADVGPAREPELLTLERVAILQQVEMLATVPGRDLVAIARALDEVRVEAGEPVIERGAVEDWLFIVADGRVRAHLGDRLLVERGPGEVVGELALLAPAPRSASVTAVEPSLLLRLRRGPFDELLQDHGAISRAVLGVLARRLQELADADSPADPAPDPTLGSGTPPDPAPTPGEAP
jgi:CRP/FNR family cyclic AMP-dependent transcriptional regulator